MIEQWGLPLGEVMRVDDRLAIPGLIFGNVFVGIQPPRGFGADPMAIYHSPDLPPTHHYLAYYRWLQHEFGAQAVIHMGKHGNLEWLPGKATALSNECYPEIMLSDLPNFYPYIINNPGEGTQAKRRGHAVIIDHLIPPMTQAETYDDLARLEQLLDEYYRMASLDPSKLPYITQQIWTIVTKNNLDRDLKVDRCPEAEEFDHFLQEIDGYLCELGDAQIRDGLHIFGEAPQGEQRVGLIQAMMRLDNGEVPSLRKAIAASLGIDLGTCSRRPRARRSATTRPCASVTILPRPSKPASSRVDASIEDDPGLAAISRRSMDDSIGRVCDRNDRRGLTSRGLDPRSIARAVRSRRSLATTSAASIRPRRGHPPPRPDHRRADQHPPRPRRPVRARRAERGPDSGDGPHPADGAELLQRRHPHDPDRDGLAGRRPGGRPADREVSEGERRRISPERRHRRLGDQHDADPRRRRGRDPPPDGRPARLGAREPPAQGGGTRPAGRAGPAPDRRDRPDLRLLPRRLPQRRRPDRPGRRAGRGGRRAGRSELRPPARPAGRSSRWSPRGWASSRPGRSRSTASSARSRGATARACST